MSRTFQFIHVKDGVFSTVISTIIDLISLHQIKIKVSAHTSVSIPSSQEEELSSSSSEEEESDQRQNEDLFGKVVCVDGVAPGDKKKSAWYPALVSHCPSLSTLCSTSSTTPAYPTSGTHETTPSAPNYLPV